jgi:drug/metabolite transporter (DMT)-like permease
LTFRTYFLLVLFIALKAFGNLSLAFGTKHFPESLSFYPLLYIRAMFDPFVAAGIVMLILALLTRMALLSVADLSFVLPLTAVGYVFAALLGHFLLHEEVSPWRWLGTLLIFGGVVLVSTTTMNTTQTTDGAQ